MILWTLAARNVLRHRRRSVITTLSIAVGLAALTFLWAFLDGMNRQMVENTTRYFAGDVQIHLRGYHADPSLDLAFGNVDRLTQAVRDDPGVQSASVRLEAGLLASHADKSRGVMVYGVDPAEEARVIDLFKAVVEGVALRDGSDRGVLIGEKLAEALALKAGDEIVLVGQAFDGSLASGRMPVRGVFRTKIDEFDGYVAVMARPLLGELLAAPGEATAVALRLRDRGQLVSDVERLSNRLDGRYEVVGWPRLLPMVAVSVRYHEVMGYVVLLIFFVMVAAGVANPVLMSVLDRTREFGVMLALGTRPASLLRLVLYEAMLLGGVGVVLGNLAGLGVTLFSHRIGIDLGAFEQGLRTMQGLSDIIYPVVRLERSAAISGLVFVTTILAALYPAAKAAGLAPVAAIRGIAAGAADGRSVHASRRAMPRARWPVFVLIGMRNVLRNRKRSAITVGGTAFAILAYVFMYGYFDGFGEQIVDNGTRYVTGHLQLERQGFRRDLAPELAFDNPAPLLAELRSLPNVEGAAPRVQAQALASSATKSAGIVLLGVDPVAERAITFIHRTLVEGTALQEGAERDIVVGRELAGKLGLRLGEKLVVMSPGLGGELGTAAYRIRGIFATESSAFDGSMAFVTLPAAQALLGLGQRVSTINVRLADRERIDASASLLRKQLEGKRLALSVVPWTQLMPRIADMLGLIRAIRAVVVGVFLLVVALAVMNTAFMAVAERTQEFGVMMALGTTPAAIVRMVLYETLALMLLAALLGYAAGAALVSYLGYRGLDLSSLYAGYSTIPGLTGIAHPKLVLSSIAAPGLALFVGALLVSLYPAVRAGRLDPSTAIRRG